MSIITKQTIIRKLALPNKLVAIIKDYTIKKDIVSNNTHFNVI